MNPNRNYFLTVSVICVLLMLVLSAAEGRAQSFSYNSSSTSHTTPAGIAPGSPTGSYALSGFETINPYSGKINFNLPLLSIGGRGSAGYTMSLQIQQNWEINHHVFDPNQGPCPQPMLQCYAYFATHTFTPVDHLWSDNENQGFSPGVMKGRQYGDPRGSGGCGGAHPPPAFSQSLTRLTFVKPDGSEMEFRDTLNGGKAMTAGCNTPPVPRGTEFVTVDGSFATFVSDSAITDVKYVENQNTGMTPTGTLKWSDGTVYRIIDGQVTKITDKNGNYWLFDYTQGVKVTDSLGRIFNGPSYIRNNPNGGGTVTRGIQIEYDQLSNRLRSGYSLRGVYDLFPVAYSDPSLNSNYDAQVVSAVKLPDNRKYQFYYNSYGELARVVLPTGGEIEYDWQADSGLSGGGNETEGGDYIVHRRVEKRRVYKENRQLQTETVYQRLATAPPGEPTSGPLTIVDELTYDNISTPQLLGKVRHFYYGTATRPAFYNKNNPVTDPAYTEGREYKTESYASDGTTLLGKVETAFQPGTPLTANPTADINGRVAQTMNTLGDTNQVSKQTFSYDQYNNQTDAYEYDFGAGAAGAFLRRTHADFVTDTNYTGYAGAHLRHLPVQSWVSSDMNGSAKASLSQIEYDNYAADANHAGLVNRTNVVGFDATNFSTNNTRRGNATAVTSYEDAQNPATSATVNAYTQYDILGNVVKAIDGKGNASTVDYTDRFGYPDGEARSNTSPTELGSLSTFAYPTSATNALGWTVSYNQFDYYTGQAVDAEDLNGNVSSVFYNDLLDRPTQAISANNRPTQRSQKTIVYDDAITDRKTTVTADLFAFGDNLSKAESYYDGLGRTTESRKYESNGGYVAAQTQYDALGRAYKQSNPYRPTEVNANNPVFWTTSFFDDAGRMIKVRTPDNAEVNTNYLGNAVTVTDQAGKQRRSITNAIGQLKRVDEPNDASGLGTIDSPNQATSYSYNTLNNLVQVNQGVQSRSFVYDSLGRLKSATNPESGLISYSYDNNSNLQTKTDARNVVTTYGYDNLNRVLSRSYAGEPTGQTPTPAVNYFYDNMPNAKGKLIKVSSATSTTEYTGFDILGRVTNHKQTTDGNAYTTSYTYNLSGALVEETYPSTRVVKNVLDTNGELELVQSRKNQSSGFWNYAKSFTYTAAGGVSSMQLGNGKWESTQFNSRLQPTQIALGTTQGAFDKLKLNYDYGALQNNGNVQSQTITVPTVGQAQGFTATQNYNYDSLNRLKFASETISNNQTWKQTFTYDRYGNRNFDAANGNTTTLGSCPANQCNPTVDVTNNRFTTNQGYTYDLVGNVITDAQGRTFNYDAENKQKSVSDNTGTIGQYFYDGNGKRVKKVTDTETTIFVYDAAGKLVAEYSNQTAGNQVSYLTADNLGTPRINTDANGNVIARHDYLPFGEEAFTPQRTQGLNYTGDTVRQDFTGYTKDDETDLDFAEARMYANKLGRFTTADPLFIDFGRLADPQQINLYGYVRNNPLSLIDPSGLDIEVTGSEKDNYRKRLQASLSFKIQINAKTNKVEIIDDKGNVVDDKKALKEIGKGLKGGDKELFKAITDKDNHVTIETVRKDNTVFFGAYNGKGKNTIDFGDVDLLDSKENSGGISAAQVVGHETLEAYSSSKGGINGEYGPSHAYANQYFGGLEEIENSGRAYAGDSKQPTLATHISGDFSVTGSSGTKERIFLQLGTPIPLESIKQALKSKKKILSNVVGVTKIP